MHSAAPIHLAVSFAAMAARGAGIACIGNDGFVSRRKEGRGVSYANDVAGSSVAPPGKSRCCKREKLRRILIVACPAKNVSQPCDTVDRRRLALRQDCTPFLIALVFKTMQWTFAPGSPALHCWLRYGMQVVVDLPGLAKSSFSWVALLLHADVIVTLGY
jgi:hypothetical protein